MRVLLLGAAGFIGRHVRAAALAEQVEVVSHARRSRGRDSGWIDADLETADQAGLEAMLRRAAPTVVINAVGSMTGDETRMEALNARLPARLATALQRAAPHARLVHIGSSAEYGPVSPGSKASEAMEPEPVTAYGRSKLSGTLAILGAAEGGLDTVALRVFNPIGAGMDRESLPGRAAVAIADALASGTQQIRLGSLDAYRDFVDVRDVADAVMAAVAARTLAERLCNVGSGRAVQVRELVRRLCVVAGFHGQVEETESPSIRSGDVAWQEADIERAAALLGWRPRHDLHDSVRSLWSSVGATRGEPVSG